MSLQRSRSAQRCVVDPITDHTAEVRLYLRAITVTRSRRIVSYATNFRLKSSPTARALNNAAVSRSGEGEDITGGVVHNDHEGQTPAKQFLRTLDLVGTEVTAQASALSLERLMTPRCAVPNLKINRPAKSCIMQPGVRDVDIERILRIPTLHSVERVEL